MIEKINWSSKYDVGITEIDFQHKYFLKLINRLALNHDFFLEKGLVKTHLSELDKYARFHFKSEENIMLLVDYPDLVHHMQLHIELIEQLNYQGFKVIDSTDNMSRFIMFLREWFLNHTVNEDKKLFEYIEKVDGNFSGFFDK
ncbi:hemerythrin family protein [uncultured Desulfobacter sp.]|uniref:bacteriohemerythrin n=1 Tax=uncultured Desulfobacter sp. TaxID=240139 RepID=UPI002AAAF12E|nr:hemerythrin family protein [uncultured Desulfobacter sp.]